YSTFKAMDIEAKVYYLGQGLKTLRLGQAEKIKLGSFPTVLEMINKTLEMGIEIYVCEASKQMLGWETVELLPEPIFEIFISTESFTIIVIF
ncbi:unnamed protein product, partial [marine sediment metagenome]